MKLQHVVVFLVILIKLINGLFIRSNNVYKHVINDIQKYYQCDYIFIFYTSPRNETAFDVAITTRLINLQLYCNKNFIYSNIINIRTFSDQLSLKMKIMKNYLRKSLFVVLNDFNEEKLLFDDLLLSSLDISMPKWLFFLDNRITSDEFFLKTYIPFNSNCLVSFPNSDNSEIITEIYQIHKDDRLRKNILAFWNLDNGIQFSKVNFYQRRNNLFGFHFRVSTVLDSPYTLMSNTQNHEIQLDGIIGKVMEHLKQELNFTITYRFTKEYGIRLNNGSWTGGIADLISNVSDIFASNIGMTSSRKEVIDFTIPLFFSDDCFFFKKPIKEYVEWNKFLKPFQKDIWIIIICLIIVTSSIVTVILLFHKRVNNQILIGNRESCFLSDNILVIYGAFCGQAIRRSFISSVFIIHITLHLTATVVFAAYAAVLISSLTISDFKAPFRTLQGFHQDGTYTMGFIESSMFNDLFKVSNDSVMKKIYNTAIKHNAITSTIKEGINRICWQKKYAFLAPKYSGSVFPIKDCTLITSKAVMRISKGIGLSQHNPFRGLFNYHIARMKKHGILNRIIKGTIQISTQSENELWEAVKIIDIMPLLVLLIINIILGFIILSIEKQIDRKFKKKRLSNLLQFSMKYLTNTSKK